MTARHTSARVLAWLAPCAAFCACIGTTGGDVIDFPVAAAGPATVTAPFSFTTDRGYSVTLTTAKLHIGALYLDQSEPISGAQNGACILPGTYVAEETDPLDVDLLSPALQPFPRAAHGTTLAALVGQVWLTGGDVNVIADQTPILVLRGTASSGSATFPFTARITIGANRQAQGVAVAGAAPICKQRIVSPIHAPITVKNTGGLVVRIDPRLLFVNVDFAALQKSGDSYAFSDDPTSASYTQPSQNLYQNLRSAGALYTFSWSSDL